MTHKPICSLAFLVLLSSTASLVAAEKPCESLAPFVKPPAAYEGRFGSYKKLTESPKSEFRISAEEWAKRRKEIFSFWDKTLGPWPSLILHPRVEILKTTAQEGFTEQRVRVEIA